MENSGLTPGFHNNSLILCVLSTPSLLSGKCSRNLEQQLLDKSGMVVTAREDNSLPVRPM